MNPKPDIEEISIHEAQRHLAEYQLVDVRSPAEFTGPLGHLPGACSLPLPEIEARGDDFDATRPILMICRSGQRSARACKWFGEHRPGRAINLAGGMIAWNRAGYPVERTVYKNTAELLNAITDWYKLASGEQENQVEIRIRAAMREANESTDAPTPGGLMKILTALEKRLEENDTPVDIDLAMNAFRDDVVHLAATQDAVRAPDA